jgi:hypothetical protein
VDPYGGMHEKDERDLSQKRYLTRIFFLNDHESYYKVELNSSGRHLKLNSLASFVGMF